jgi:hypothetical protein
MALKPKIEPKMVRRTSGIHLRLVIHRNLISLQVRGEVGATGYLKNTYKADDFLRLFCFAQSGESVGEWTRKLPVTVVAPAIHSYVGY